MKSNTKSSVTLPPSELRLILELQKKIGAKSKVEVIRRGLAKLKEVTDRDFLRASYAEAAASVRNATEEELKELDFLTGEGLKNK